MNSCMPSYRDKFDYDIDADTLSECYGIQVGTKNKKGIPVEEISLNKKS
jgi:hypothetical protein